MESIGLLKIVDLGEALEEPLRNLPQPLPLALQQLPFFNHLISKFHLQDGINDLSKQFLREDAGKPNHKNLIQECITYVIYLRTLKLYVKLLPALRVGHEVINAGEVVGVQVVLVLLGLDRIVELWQIVVGYDFIEVLEIAEVLKPLLAVLLRFREPLFNDGRCALQSLERVLHIDDQLLYFFGLERACFSAKVPRNQISSFSRFIDSICASSFVSFFLILGLPLFLEGPSKILPLCTEFSGNSPPWDFLQWLQKAVQEWQNLPHEPSPHLYKSIFPSFLPKSTKGVPLMSSQKLKSSPLRLNQSSSSDYLEVLPLGIEIQIMVDSKFRCINGDKSGRFMRRIKGGEIIESRKGWGSGIAIRMFYVFIGYYQSMGLFCSYCLPNIDDHYLTLTLLKASERAKITYDAQEINSINKHISSRSNQPLQLTNCNLLFQNQEQPQQPIERQPPKLPNEARLIVKTYDRPNHGMIVYQSGYFIGRLDKNRANGEGEMFLIEQLKTKEEKETLLLLVQGKWNNDIITQGRAFDRNHELLLTFRWIIEMREINVKFAKGNITEYTGQGEFTQARTLEEMLTGKCKIIFKDKSVYSGTVLKGKLDTQNSWEKEAIFETAAEKYKGGYVSGRRHGKSLIQRKQDGYLFTYQLMWDMGVPDLTTLKLLSSDPRATLFRQSANQQQ